MKLSTLTTLSNLDNIKDVLVVDSRIIAQELGIAHESFMTTIKKYETQTEEAFGGLRFEIGVPSSPSGNPPQHVLLTVAKIKLKVCRTQAESKVRRLPKQGVEVLCACKTLAL